MLIRLRKQVLYKMLFIKQLDELGVKSDRLAEGKLRKKQIQV